MDLYTVTYAYSIETFDKRRCSPDNETEMSYLALFVFFLARENLPTGPPYSGCPHRTWTTMFLPEPAALNTVDSALAAPTANIFYSTTVKKITVHLNIRTKFPANVGTLVEAHAKPFQAFLQLLCRTRHVSLL